jgi:hypothetical protein
MMRKLAVTVFVLSLAALGCGSDSGTPSKADTAVSPDGSSVKPETNSDQAIGAETQSPDLAIDLAQGSEVKAEVQLSEAGSTSEAGQVTEAGIKPEVNKPVDVQPGVDQGTPRLDGGAVDSGAAVDGGSSAVDGGSVG